MTQVLGSYMLNSVRMPAFIKANPPVQDGRGMKEPDPREIRSIIHDLNNVFTRILGTLDLVLDDLPENPLLQKDLQSILDSSKEGLAVVDRIREKFRL